ATTAESRPGLEKNRPKSIESPGFAPPLFGSTTAAADAIVAPTQTARAAQVFVFMRCCFNLLTSGGKSLTRTSVLTYTIFLSYYVGHSRLVH
ncbi:hypothetical protein, partial [Streptomyces sp. RP5T]|uniref:hypothetical protein n=1 Tax=Streptomyces sp. RP5T TaxID=2490848 RepID=UPI001C8B8A2B